MCEYYTFVRTRNNLMFLICMSEHAFRAEHFSIIFAIKFYFFIFVNLALRLRIIFTPTSTIVYLGDGQSSENGIIDREVINRIMMSNLIKWALDYLVFHYLFEAFKTESMATRQGEWLLLRMVIGFEANTAFKN